MMIPARTASKYASGQQSVAAELAQWRTPTSRPRSSRVFTMVRYRSSWSRVKPPKTS